MSLVDASERLVAPPKDWSLADSAVEDVDGRWASRQGSPGGEIRASAQSPTSARRRMEPLWSPVVATGGNQRQID